jgi:aryl-alcohol dehydrogenase-like predicted oxidoreductase
VIIATKVGSAIGGKGVQLKKNYIIDEAEKSLKRLQTDYIDLYFSHYDDVNIPIEEPLLAYEQLIKDGKVRWIAASNFTAPRLKEAIIASGANNLPQYQVYQPGYNLYDRADFEKDHAAVCKEFNLGVIPYYSLASGFLTGKYRTEADLKKSLRGTGVAKYLNKRGFEIIDALQGVAANHNTEIAAVALAWLIQQPGITAPIASVTNLQQLDSFAAAVDLQLSPEDIKTLNQAST